MANTVYGIDPKEGSRLTYLVLCIKGGEPLAKLDEVIASFKDDRMREVAKALCGYHVESEEAKRHAAQIAAVWLK